MLLATFTAPSAESLPGSPSDAVSELVPPHAIEFHTPKPAFDNGFTSPVATTFVSKESLSTGFPSVSTFAIPASYLAM